MLDDKTLTEEQMRRALGLDSQQRTTLTHNNRRSFVRDDNQIDVRTISRTPQNSPNDQLAAARQTMRTLGAEKEILQRELAAAKSIQQNLHTQFKHMEMARNEAIGQIEIEKRTSIQLKEQSEQLRSQLSAAEAARDKIAELYKAERVDHHQTRVRFELYKKIRKDAPQEPKLPARRGRAPKRLIDPGLGKSEIPEVEFVGVAALPKTRFVAR